MAYREVDNMLRSGNQTMIRKGTIKERGRSNGYYMVRTHGGLEIFDVSGPDDLQPETSVTIAKDISSNWSIVSTGKKWKEESSEETV